jgi:hypothetical protein
LASSTNFVVGLPANAVADLRPRIQIESENLFLIVESAAIGHSTTRELRGGIPPVESASGNLAMEDILASVTGSAKLHLHLVVPGN